jgi:atypical dual specificity phosphatase
MTIPIPFGNFTIFRSAIPQSEENVQTWKDQYGIDRVVCLLEDWETRLVPKRFNGYSDLFSLYAAKNLKVTRFSIEDYLAPSIDQLSLQVDEIITQAINGEKILIHCAAGRGRTGLMLAAIAIKHFQIDDLKAINWIRTFIANAIESNVQQELLKKFAQSIKK